MKTEIKPRPPRSPRSRLGGYSLLPRMLDKARATLAGHGWRENAALNNSQARFAAVKLTLT